MSTPQKSSEPDDSKSDMIKLQYEQTAESLRNHNNLLWQTPTVAVGVNSGILVVSFEYVTNEIIRSLLILIGICLSFGLLIVLVKQRYFTLVEINTLKEIEKSTEGLQLVQRRTDANCSDEQYWFTKTAKPYTQTRTAYNVMKSSLIFVIIIFTFIFFYTTSGILF